MVADDYRLTRWFWRAMGSILGQQVMIDPMAFIFESDLLTLENNSRIDEMATVLCHTFCNGGMDLKLIYLLKLDPPLE